MAVFSGTKIPHQDKLVLNFDARDRNIFKSGQNLLLDPETPNSNNANWSKGPNTAIVSTGLADPEGGTDAISYSSTGAGSNSYVQQEFQYKVPNEVLNSGGALISPITYTVSVWAKLISGSAPTSGNIITVNYAPSTSTNFARASSGVSGLTTEWKRFSVTYSNFQDLSGGLSAGTGSIFFLADFNTSCTVAIWGAQAEESLAPTQVVTSNSVSRDYNTNITSSTGLIIDGSAGGHNPLDKLQYRRTDELGNYDPKFVFHRDLNGSQTLRGSPIEVRHPTDNSFWKFLHDGTTDYTISFEFSIEDGYTYNDWYDMQYIFSTGVYTGDIGVYLRWYGTNFQYRIRNSGNNNQWTAAGTTTGGGKFIITFDSSSNECKLYKDGSLLVTTGTTQGLDSGASNPFVFSSSNSQYLTGTGSPGARHGLVLGGVLNWESGATNASGLGLCGFLGPLRIYKGVSFSADEVKYENSVGF